MMINKLKGIYYLPALAVLFAGCKKDVDPPVNTPVADVAQKGTAEIFAGNGLPGAAAGTHVASFTGAWGIVRDKNGNLFVSDYNTTLIRKVTPDGTVSTFAGNSTDANNGDPKSTDGVGTKASFTAPA